MANDHAYEIRIKKGEVTCVHCKIRKPRYLFSHWELSTGTRMCKTCKDTHSGDYSIDLKYKDRPCLGHSCNAVFYTSIKERFCPKCTISAKPTNSYKKDDKRRKENNV